MGILSFLAKELLIIIIYLYKYILSPIFGSNCRFYPTCSNYAIYAIRHIGVFKGCFLIIKRVFHCNPLNLGGGDFIQNKK